MKEGRSAAEYERLAEAELRAAATATSDQARNAHLNQAAVYAYRAEQATSPASTPQSSTD